MADYLIPSSETTLETLEPFENSVTSETSVTSEIASVTSEIASGTSEETHELKCVEIEYIPRVDQTTKEIVETIRTSDNNNLQRLIEIAQAHNTEEEVLLEFTKKLFQIIQTERFLPKLRQLQDSHKFIPTLELKNELYQLLSNKGLSFYVSQDGILEFYSAINLCPHDIHSKVPDCLCIYRCGILIYDREIINKHPSLSDFFGLLKKKSDTPKEMSHSMSSDTNALVSFASDFHSADFGKDIYAVITFVVSHHLNLLNVADFWEPVLKEIHYNFFQHESIKSLIFCKESLVPLDGFQLIKSSNDYQLRDYGIHTHSRPKSHPGKRSNPTLVTYDDIDTSSHSTPHTSHTSHTPPKRQKLNNHNNYGNRGNQGKSYASELVDWIRENNINDSKRLQNYTPYLIQQINENCYRSVERVLSAYFENKYKSANKHRSADGYLDDFANQTQRFIYFYETNINKRFWCFISDRSDAPMTNIELRRLMEDDFHFICCFKPFQ
jgi:hypothetical protein